MIKIKKGVEIYQFSDYDLSHTCSVRKMLVTSFGKEQGTAVGIENGKPVKYRLYTKEEGKTLIPVADVADVKKEALRRAKEIKQKWIEHYRDRSYYLQNADDGYHISLTKEARIQLEQEPDVKFINF